MAAVLLGEGFVLPVVFGLSLPPASSDNGRELFERNFILIEWIPRYIATGFLMVCFSMFLPASGVVSYEFKQKMIVVLHFMPFFVAAMACWTWFRHKDDRNRRRANPRAEVVAKKFDIRLRARRVDYYTLGDGFSFLADDPRIRAAIFG